MCTVAGCIGHVHADARTGYRPGSHVVVDRTPAVRGTVRYDAASDTFTIGTPAAHVPLTRALALIRRGQTGRRHGRPG